MEQIIVDIGDSTVHVRGLSGNDELNLAAGPGVVRRLIARLLQTDATGTPESAEALSVAQRDRVLAALWTHTFSDTILATHRCAACAERFDLSFSLASLVEALWRRERPAEVAALGEDGWVLLHSRQRVRAATGADEAAVAALPPVAAAEALRARCVAGEEPGAALSAAVLDRVLDWLDPVIDTELDARCPECGHRQEIRFSIEHYFLTAMQREKRRVLRDVHQLASAYGWSLDEILNLSRQERRTLVAYAETELAGSRTRAWS